MNVHFQLLPEAVGLADAGSKTEILASVAGLFSAVYGIEQAVVAQGLAEREALGSTGFGRGVAIPHARVAGIHRPSAALIRLARPVDFDAVDGAPVKLVFGLISPEQSGQGHLHALAAISRLMRNERVQEALLAASSEAQLYGVLANVIDRDAA
jgi:PTS system nitrogen regulatory IIA component